jgi:geranylgeranyl diphosphate synthase type II
MHTFQETINLFEEYFKKQQPFPEHPNTLYDPCRYILEAGGKRIRPALCLMATELFKDNIPEDAYNVAMAIELFHNFTLIHDDIMDKAPLRRGRETVHQKYGLATGILSGDVMNIFSYKLLGKINPHYLPAILNLVNTTAIEVCEGQQWDMDFEVSDEVTIDDYLKMITLKTSVLLAGALKAGAILADAAEEDAQNLYEFGKNLGIAFQLQDDFLDTFGDGALTGKKPGGDIRSNKKTFLMLKAQSLADQKVLSHLNQCMQLDDEEKVKEITNIFKENNIDNITKDIVNQYFELAMSNMDSIRMGEERKAPLRALAHYLLTRDH